MTPPIHFRFATAAATLAAVLCVQSLLAQSAVAQSASALPVSMKSPPSPPPTRVDTTRNVERVQPDSMVDLRVAARRVIDAAKFAAFITVDAAGHPVARTVQPAAPDSGMVVWFATNPRSRKVSEVVRDSRATLYYFDPASLAYVTLVGRARIVRDRAEQDRHWNTAWTAHYPDRKNGVVLVEVTPERLEVVDIKRGVRGDSATWRPPTLPLGRSRSR